jgi:hypothetical protein
MEATELLAYGPYALDVTVTTIMGLGLAATCGLRAFLPLLVINLLAMTGYADLGESYAFMAGWPATVVFGTATVLEIAGDKFPGVDHAMDAIGVFIRPTAAAVAASSMIARFDPLAGIALGLIAGATAAAGVQVVKAKARLITSAFTAGMGNWAVSLGEDAVVVSGVSLAVLAPALLGAIGLFFTAIVAFVLYRRHERKLALAVA